MCETLDDRRGAKIDATPPSIALAARAMTRAPGVDGERPSAATTPCVARTFPAD
jgi:hypothetical protein